MINYRYLSIVIYLICFSILPNSAGLAKNLRGTAKHVSAKNIEIYSRQKIGGSSSLQLDNRQTSPSLVAQAEPNPNQSAKLDRYWYLAGIAATSLLFLYTLTALFKSEKPLPKAQSQELVTSNNKVDLDTLDLTTEDEAIAISEVAIEPSVPMIGMDAMEELVYEPLLTEAFEPSAPLRVLKSGMTTVTESVSEQPKPDNPAVDADVLGRLTIVTSKTTKIDVVFELIQDLQLSNSLENIAAQKDLRRKAIWELGQTNDFRAVEPLIRIMPQVDSLDKSLILDAITQIANRSLKTINETLQVSLSESDLEIRNDAIRDLNTLYQSISLVTVNLSRITEENSDREVQQIARWALEQFNQVYLPAASSQLTTNL